MRLLISVIVFTFFSCGQSADKEKKSQEDPLAIKTDTTTVVNSSKDTISEMKKTTELETQVNTILQTKLPNQWRVVNDSISNWPKDVFDYFIAGKRKENPDYPYIAKEINTELLLCWILLKLLSGMMMCKGPLSVPIPKKILVV
jgi:hypothetical protein